MSWYRDDPKREKRRGIAAHKLAATVLREWLAALQNDTKAPEVAAWLGRRVDHFPVTEQLASSVTEYVEFCSGYMADADRVLIEERIAPDCRVDFAAVCGDHAVIVDFKHGRSRGLGRFETYQSQLTRYEAALRSMFPELESVDTHVVAPRRWERIAQRREVMEPPPRRPPPPPRTKWVEIIITILAFGVAFLSLARILIAVLTGR